MTRTLLKRLFGIDTAELSFWQNVFLGASLAVLAAGILVSLTDLINFEGSDFVIRYVQARCGFFSLDPYRLTDGWWLNGISEDLHTRYFRGVPRLTNGGCFSPCLLLFYMPLGLLECATARYASGILEWLAFLGSLMLLARTVKDGQHRAIAVALILFFFSASAFWRLHVERGQYYIFTVVLIAASFYHLLSTKRDFVAGLFLGVAIAMRPTMIFIALPFALCFRWRLLAGICVSGLVTGLLALWVFGWQGFESFVWISRKYQLFAVDHAVIAEWAKDTPPPQAFEISGKNVMAALPSINTTFAGLIRVFRPAFDALPISVNQSLALGKAAVLALAAALTLLVVPWPLRRRPDTCLLADADRLFCLTGVAAVNIVEYALPIRAAYADVFYMLAIMLALPFVIRHACTWIGVVLLVSLAAQQNLLGLVNGWYAIPVRVFGLTVFTLAALYRWRFREGRTARPGDMPPE